MKKKITKLKLAIILLSANLLINTSIFGQAPQKMSYQAVIRNSSNALVTSTPVGMKISVLQGTATGTAVYVETQTPSTNSNGLVSLSIGTGTVVSGTFAGINWGAGPYFIKTETDPTGGTTYTTVGTNQLMSVPYALFSANGTPGAAGTNGTNGTNGAPGAAGTNGTNGTNGGVGGFTHYLGEAYLGGIIYYLYKGSDGLEHGLIVALTESTTTMNWQSSYSLTGANRAEDGAFNTAQMTTNSPVASYIATLGAGWYLPSIGELILLENNIYSAQKGLRSASGASLLSVATSYWSSTEDESNTAFAQNFSNDLEGPTVKGNNWKARGIRAF